MIIEVESGNFRESHFFDYITYNRSYYANDYKSIKSDIQNYISANPDGINHINIKVYNRPVFYNGKNEIPTIELSGEGNIDINKKMFTVREYSGVFNIIVSEDEFFTVILQWASVIK